MIRDNIIWYNTQRQQEGLNNHTPTEQRNHALHLHHEHCPKKNGNQYRQQQNLASHDQSHQNTAAPAKQYDACAGAALLYRDEDLEIATQILCDLECHF